MKASSLFPVSALVALLSAFLLAVPASHAAPRTPVSCSYEQFYFGQDLLLVVSEDSHLFKATSQGWQLLTPPVVDYEVSVTPDGTIYLSDHPVDDYNFYRSTDGGTTWHISGRTPEDGSDMRVYGPLFPSPVPNLLFLRKLDIPYSGGLLRSVDGGVVWQDVPLPGGLMAMAFSPDFARDGLAYAVDDGRFWGSVMTTMDWGKTWTAEWGYIEPNRPRVGVAFSPHFATDRTAFSDMAGNPPRSLYKSTDGGATWFEINELAVDGPPAFSPVYEHDQTFIVGQDARPRPLPGWRAHSDTDVGQSQRLCDRLGRAAAGSVLRRPPPLPAAHRYYLPLTFSGPPPLEFWLVAQEGASGDCYLYRSRDDGASWQEIAVSVK